MIFMCYIYKCIYIAKVVRIDKLPVVLHIHLDCIANSEMCIQSVQLASALFKDVLIYLTDWKKGKVFVIGGATLISKEG